MKIQSESRVKTYPKVYERRIHKYGKRIDKEFCFPFPLFRGNCQPYTAECHLHSSDMTCPKKCSKRAEEKTDIQCHKKIFAPFQILLCNNLDSNIQRKSARSPIDFFEKSEINQA